MSLLQLLQIVNKKYFALSHIKHQNGEKYDVSDFDHGMIVGVGTSETSPGIFMHSFF